MTLEVHATDSELPVAMFFDLNGQDYNIKSFESVQGENSKNLISVTDGKNRIEFFLNLFHNYENEIQSIKENSSNKFFITNAVSSEKYQHIISVDFVFNRTKAYYSQFPFGVGVKRWYYSGALGYIVPIHPDPDLKNKIFVAPNKTYNGTRFYRTKIVNLLKDNYQNLGYIGNYDDDQKFFLHSHIECPFIENVKELESRTELRYNHFAYHPPHNEYYKNTFISIYGETIEYGNSICVSEKTYDPLIKGHFVLPFSTSGFIKHLRNMGFKFPTFINYQYDEAVDNNRRYSLYNQEVQRLLALDIDTWRENWHHNYNIIRHNQLLFQKKDYDTIDFYKLLKKEYL
jgi:hypothetical protein